MTTSSIRTLIPFVDDNYASLIQHPVFAAVIADIPEFEGLENGRFEIFDMFLITLDQEDNEARAGGTRLKEKDLEKLLDNCNKMLGEIDTMQNDLTKENILALYLLKIYST